jgi:hypothetical protein
MNDHSWQAENDARQADFRERVRANKQDAASLGFSLFAESTGPFNDQQWAMIRVATIQAIANAFRSIGEEDADA